MSSPSNESTSDSGAGTLPWIANLIAIILIAAYLFAIFKAWPLVDVEETIWLRRFELLGGLEALAFAAAGAVLGVTVQRPAVKAAQNRARIAEQRAETNAKAARAGKAVIAAASAKAEKAEEQVLNFMEPNRVEQGTRTEFEELVKIAELMD